MSVVFDDETEAKFSAAKSADEVVITTIESPLIGLNIQVKKNILGDYSFECPNCKTKVNINKDNILSDLGVQLSKVQRYSEVAKDLNSMSETKDYLSFSIERNKCMQKYADIIGWIKEAASVTLDFKCSLCEKSYPFSISIGTKSKAKLPTYWTSNTTENVSRLSEEVERNYITYENDSPESTIRLFNVLELIEALETKPFTWKGYEKLIFLINWDTEEKSPQQCAEEFAAKIKALQGDIKKAKTIAEEFNSAMEKLSKFETNDVGSFFNDITNVFGGNCMDLEKKTARKARRLLAGYLLWLDMQIYSFVKDGKI